MTNETKSAPKIGIVDVQMLVNRTPSVLALREEQQQQNIALQQWVNSVNAQIAQELNQANRNYMTQQYQLELNQRQQIVVFGGIDITEKVAAELIK